MTINEKRKLDIKNISRVFVSQDDCGDCGPNKDSSDLCEGCYIEMNSSISSKDCPVCHGNQYYNHESGGNYFVSVCKEESCR